MAWGALVPHWQRERLVKVTGIPVKLTMIAAHTHVTKVRARVAVETRASVVALQFSAVQKLVQTGNVRSAVALGIIANLVIVAAQAVRLPLCH